MKRFKLESFNNFLKHQKNNKISFKQYTHEEFVKLIQPYICELCRRLFNPTKEELKNSKENKIANDDWIFEWEVIYNGNKKESIK